MCDLKKKEVVPVVISVKNKGIIYEYIEREDPIVSSSSYSFLCIMTEEEKKKKGVELAD